MSFNKFKIDYLLFDAVMRGGGFSFILLVKLQNYKSAVECFSPNLFIRGCSSQLRVWVCVSVRWYWRTSAWGPCFLLLCGRQGFSINRHAEPPFISFYNSKCLCCRCWTWQFYSYVFIPVWWFRWHERCERPRFRSTATRSMDSTQVPSYELAQGLFET